MAAIHYDFEALQSAGTTIVYNFSGSDADWLFINGYYSPYDTSVTLGVGLGFGTGTVATVRYSPTQTYNLTIVNDVENVRGGAYRDVLTGNSLSNILVGDAFDVEGAPDWLRGEGGNDRLYGAGGGDTLSGGEGDDLLFGDLDPYDQDQGNYSPGNDTLYGENGNDTLYGGWGNNTLYGGAGLDEASYAGFFDDYGTYGFHIVANLGTGSVTVFQTDFYDGTTWAVVSDQLSGVETLRGSMGDDEITGIDTPALALDTFGYLLGEKGNDTIFGGRYQDVIYGGEGDDRMWDGGNLNAAAGSKDALYGGLGNDTYYVTMAGTAVLEFAAAGSDLVIASLDYTLAENLENLTLIDTALRGTGNAAGNVIWGNGLDNTLTGLDGSDQLIGLDGNDSLYGGRGIDQFWGGNHNDALYGGIDADWMNGDQGNDLLDGGDGNDSMAGGIDTDTLYGRTGDDTLAGDAGNDILDGGDGNDNLVGASEVDRLLGRAGDDTLIGGMGNDILTGGTGADRLNGGSGRDSFVFVAFDTGIGSLRDVILDFTSGTDRIDLRKLATGQTFIDAAPFSSVAGQIRYDATRGLILGDLDGDRAADWQILLSGTPALLATDLLL